MEDTLEGSVLEIETTSGGVQTGGDTVLSGEDIVPITETGVFLTAPYPMQSWPGRCRRHLVVIITKALLHPTALVMTPRRGCHWTSVWRGSTESRWKMSKYTWISRGPLRPSLSRWVWARPRLITTTPSPRVVSRGPEYQRILSSCCLLLLRWALCFFLFGVVLP